MRQFEPSRSKKHFSPKDPLEVLSKLQDRILTLMRQVLRHVTKVYDQSVVAQRIELSEIVAAIHCEISDSSLQLINPSPPTSSVSFRWPGVGGLDVGGPFFRARLPTPQVPYPGRHAGSKEPGAFLGCLWKHWVPTVVCRSNLFLTFLRFVLDLSMKKNWVAPCHMVSHVRPGLSQTNSPRQTSNIYIYI